MRRLLITISIVAAMATSGFSSSALGLKVGYLATAFEDQDEAAQSLGFGVSYSAKKLELFDAGLEFNMLASPWEFTDKSEFYTQKYTFTQTMIGLFVKVDIPLVVLTPYVRAGLGYYMGKVEAEISEGGQTMSAENDMKGALGYNLGAGVETFLGIYAEVIFHIVEREIDVKDTEPFGANNVAANIGYRIEF